jgi:PKHD-type hydroxylase
MLVHLRSLLGPEEATEFREKLAGARFEDGRATARGRAKEIKQNLQVPPSDPIGNELAQRLRKRLLELEAFNQVAHPRRMLPLRFCKYEVGMFYGEHLDLPLMATQTGGTQRTDVSMTVFLTPVADYDGGELAFHSDFGTKVIRGDAGDAVVYPSNTLHEVRPVTRGQRLVAITWIESLVREPARRQLLFDLMTNARALEQAHGPSAHTTALRQCHYNLLRMWAET